VIASAHVLAQRAFRDSETHNMKHHIRTLACGVALLAAIAVTLVACGGNETVASKSAAAYDEAKKKGIPIALGEHGGHTAEGAGEQSADHAAMPGMDHPKMAGTDHSAMAGMDHSKMPGMQHGSSMAGMQHGSSSTPPMVIAAPTSNAAIAQTQPAATLRSDQFDAPAPAAVEEAAKAASAMNHSMGTAPPNSPAPAQHDQHPPQPRPPAPHDHGSGEAS
jgi:hypothetical protein